MISPVLTVIIQSSLSPWAKEIHGVLSAEAKKLGEALKDGQVSTLYLGEIGETRTVLF